ncbi:hypothetical protein CPL00124_CDS0182 [Escherchia phage Stokescottia]
MDNIVDNLNDSGSHLGRWFLIVIIYCSYYLL